MNIRTFEFCICLVFRYQDLGFQRFRCSTTVERALQIRLFMQYKPNLPENQMNASSVLAKGYEADIVFWPKNPKPNFLNGKMNISYAITKDYENVRLHRRGETKPNSNPIQSQSNPIQTQFKPNSNPIYAPGINANPKALRNCSFLNSAIIHPLNPFSAVIAQIKKARPRRRVAIYRQTR